ncbi:MAG: putative immunity protein [Candidatus Thorarchaeota archaeon]
MDRINFDTKEEDVVKKKILKIANKMDQKQLAIWASECVEHVLSNFEEKYPNDNRPRKAIEVARAWVNGTMSVGEARSAALEAHAAARESEDDIACAVARAAGHVAATAHVADHAIHATNYAAKVDFKESSWQYKKLLDLKNKINENKKQDQK